MPKPWPTAARPAARWWNNASPASPIRTAKARAPSSRCTPSRHARWRTRWTRCAAPAANRAATPAFRSALKDLFDIAGEADAGRLARAGRCAAGHRTRTRRAAHAGRRLRADGPHQHDRVRLLRSRHQSALRHAVLALGPRGTAHSRRQFLGHRGVGLRRHGGRRSGHRYRRLLPHPGGVLRHRRLQAHRAPRADHRGAAAGAEPRFRGTARAECRVLRGDRCGAGGRDAGAAGAGQI